MKRQSDHQADRGIAVLAGSVVVVGMGMAAGVPVRDRVGRVGKGDVFDEEEDQESQASEERGPGILDSQFSPSVLCFNREVEEAGAQKDSCGQGVTPMPGVRSATSAPSCCKQTQSRDDQDREGIGDFLHYQGHELWLSITILLLCGRRSLMQA